MNMYDKYIQRLDLSNRPNIDVIVDRSSDLSELNFHTSPSFYQVDIDGEMVDTIINRTNDYNIKLIHFRRDYDAKVGSVITFQDKRYLLLETDEDVIYSFGKMEECNNVFKVQNGEAERVQIDTDRFGRPIYDYVVNYIDTPCIVRDKYYSATENTQLPLPEGKLQIVLKYQESPNIEINKEFEMYGKPFKIADISYTDVVDGIGIMTIHAERRDDRSESD